MNTRTITILTVLLHAGACAPLEPAAPQQAPPPRPAPVIQAKNSEAELLAAYFESTRAQSKDEYKNELASAQRRLAATPTPALRTQLALLLSAPHAESREFGQALKLLDEVIKDTQTSASVKNFAAMLQSYVAASARQEENVASLSQRVKEERKRADQAQAKQDGSTQALEQKLKEEQKKSEIALAKQEDNIQQLSAKLRDEQKRADDLQQKLDAIMKIEKSLIERQQTKDAAKELPKEVPKEIVKEPK
jgi:predicted ribosome quality control (RQC) complex YloA/Tae2 family protein